MKAIVTGGAGFIGRWVVKALLERDFEITVIDDLSNGSDRNLAEFSKGLKEFIKGDIRDEGLLAKVFTNDFDICFHLAAQINVQDSIDNPRDTFDINVVATFNIMEHLRRKNIKMVFASSALIYDKAGEKPIDEKHPLKAGCPYVASKITGENIVLSYYHAYNHPIVIVRPFSAYGPFQRFDSEGGVMSIFLERKLLGKPLEVFGDGKQTRDFFYAEDCADFIVLCGLKDGTLGEIFNAGSGRDMNIIKLAEKIAGNTKMIKFVPHHHPQSEVSRLVCDYNKAEKILGWAPKVDLSEGIKRTEKWVGTYI